MSNIASLKNFKKGKDPRRNVTGANKGSGKLQLKEALIDALKKIGEGNADPMYILLIKRMLKMAIVEGNEAMIRLIWNYLEGMPQQFTDITSLGDKVVFMPPEIIDKYKLDETASRAKSSSK